MEGGTHFFTVVTHHRRRLFHDVAARRMLRNAVRRIRAEEPWKIPAMIVLPDHMHMIWTLPEGDSDYSRRIGRVKKAFTEAFLDSGGRPGSLTLGEQRKRYRGVWQPRFWEHTIRDARHFKMHLDYIHANPVKHGLVSWPREWAWSSFHRWRRLGEYEADWCGRVELPGSVEYYEPS